MIANNGLGRQLLQRPQESLHERQTISFPVPFGDYWLALSLAQTFREKEWHPRLFEDSS